MARWEFVLSLDRKKGIPLFRQIARALAEDVARGRLRPGDRLPGTRTLARTLRVQRLTVVAAMEELAAEGWVTTQRARGTFVSSDLPEARPRPAGGPLPQRKGMPARTAFPLPPPPPADLPFPGLPRVLFFAPNRTDTRLLDHDVIGRAYRRAIRREGAVLLSYGRPQGHERLREAIAAMLSATRGLAVRADDVCVTRGSQMAIALLARALLRPGDVVAVEELTYPPAVEAFRQQGAKVVPVPLDEAGLRVDRLRAVAQTGKLRVVYVTPHHQFPTTVSLAAGRRLELLELARTAGFAVLEEDYDHEFHYEGRPLLPLASMDGSGVVAYVGTFSKVLAPGLRIGYVVAPPPLVRSVAAHRLHIDVQGDRVMEYALAGLIEEGEVQRQVRRARREYALRREVLAEELRRWLPELAFRLPAGGLALWARAAGGVDVEGWAQRARAHGVLVTTAAAFAVDRRPRPFLRLGFALLDRREIADGVRRLAAALRAR